jgi:hypothetical protein
MHVLFLIMTLAQAAKPPVCTQDFSVYPLPIQVGSLSKPAHFGEGAVRPGLLRVQDDVCHCVPRRSSKWPALVKAHLWVEPNQGKIRIEYIIDEEGTPSIDRMLECMGEPKFSVEPMPYQTDIIHPDGRKPVFPRYPVWLYLKENSEPG